MHIMLISIRFGFKEQESSSKIISISAFLIFYTDNLSCENNE